MITARHVWWLTALTAAAGFNLAHAKEGGDQYPNGAETFMSGAIPPQGTYFINYLGYYSGTLKDGSGNTKRAPDRNGNLQDIKVNAWFDALRLVHVTGVKVLGADWTMHAILPVVRQEFDLAPLGGSRTTTGLGDLTINPFILAWHPSKNLHVAAGLDINLPTGEWDKNDPRKQIGTNYRSIEPILALTYMADNGFEASGKFMYNLKSKNKDTDYQSGKEFHFDYLLGYRQGHWAYGLGGYYLRQTSDDKQNGQKVGDGNRGRVFAYGPHMQYMNKAGDQFMLQWQHETGAKNRFEGDKLMFKYVTRF